MSKRISLLNAIHGLALAVAASLGLAQEADQPGSTVPDREIEEIVVSAQRKVENIQDVPLSISSVSGAQIRDVGIDNVHQLAEFTPNVRFTTNACCTTVFIRGFGTPFSGGAFDPSVGFAQDELAIPKEVYMSDPLYDIERFEVLRGPQGTLFGKNTPAGLFNITTVSPGKEFGGYVLGRLGEDSVHRVEGAFGGPIGEKFSFRLAGVDSRQAGDVRNTKLDLDEPATKQQAVRLKLGIKPTEALDILLIGSRAKTDSRYFHIQSADFFDSTVEFLRQYDPSFEDDPFDHRDSMNFADHRTKRTTDLVQANVRYRPGNIGIWHDPEIVAIAGWTKYDQFLGFDVDYTPADVLNIQWTNWPYKQKSFELHGSGKLPGLFGVGETDFLIGGLFSRADFSTETPLTGGADMEAYLLSLGFPDLATIAAIFGLPVPSSGAALNGDGVNFSFDQRTRSHGYFATVGWAFNERWKLTVGGRYTSEKKRANMGADCYELGFLCATVLAVTEYSDNRLRNESDFSPKVTLQFFPSKSLTLFASRSQGFKSGGFNNFSFSGTDLEVESEKAVSWELGAKGTLAHAFRYSGTLFQTEMDDLQLQNSLAGAIVQVRNAAAARTRGFEFDFDWLTPWELLTLRGSGAFTDGKFTDYTDAPAIFGSGVSSQDLSGRRMPFVSKLQFNLSPELRLPLPIRNFELSLALDALYRSDFYLDSDLDPNTLQGDYVMVGARLGLAKSDGSLSLAVLVDNITDKNVLEYKVDSPIFPGGYATMQEFGRSVAIQARYNW